jgi:uncharacterized protein (DUF58 family)
MRNLNITNRLFWALGMLAMCFATGYFFQPMIAASAILSGVLLLLLIADAMTLLLFANPIKGERSCEQVLSLSDDNQILINIQNTSSFRLQVELIDELPEQLQLRHQAFFFSMAPTASKIIEYTIRPTTRGEYHFGNILAFASTRLGLTNRKITLPCSQMVPVYPSVIQLRNFELRTLHRTAMHYGVKKIRKIGHSYEFDTIKNYVAGDDYRSVNWRATGRSNQLMVNLFEDEKSQNVYSLIDTSRAMKLPFNGLSLLDYSINAGLVISNTALQKHDKAGLITFDSKIRKVIKSDNRSRQLHHILESLYNVEGSAEDANFELLYRAVTNLIRGRSLLFLFTNFESVYSAERALELLRRINKDHLLVVVIFENRELEEYSRQQATELREVYTTTIASKLIAEKYRIAALLAAHRIQAIVTQPEQLTIHAINKYLELKARGLI